MGPAFLAVLSVLAVSAVAFFGILALKIPRAMLMYLVSFSAGTFLGDVFFHLLPESTEGGFTVGVGVAVLSGIVFSFVVEKFVHWRHCHVPTSKAHPHPFAVMNLVGDGIHNFVDGVIIAASYLASVPLGIATTIAVVFHEIPQEISDLGVLLHGGMTKAKALFWNVVTAGTAVLGAVLALALGKLVPSVVAVLIPFAAGSFTYIAAADLVPEMHRVTAPRKSAAQLIVFCLGICAMAALLLFE